jgi:hypothetical protein
MNEIFTISNLFIVVVIAWVGLAYYFWDEWTKLFHRPFFSYDLLILMIAIGAILTRLTGYIAAYIPDNLAIFQIDFSRLTQITDLQLNYLIIPLIPIFAYQFWVMTIEVTKGWQKQTLRLFQYGLLLSIPVLIFQVIRAQSGSAQVFGFFIALFVLNLLVLILLEFYTRRGMKALRSGTSAILGWSIVVMIFLVGFTPFGPGEMTVNLVTQVLLTIAVLLPYFSRRFKLEPEVNVPPRHLN